ncbi:MAG TPA: Fur family transcriptional regulator, partial [Egibacteraceae bacterium]|nr:Fur family transcriptional regulator [Egibacteraceae bacterium]
DLLAVGLRPTRQRRSVVEALRERDDAVTAQELHASLRSAGEPIGLATVYRTLTALAEAGFLDTFEREGEQAFRLCGEQHHHHLVCEACNRVEEIDAAEVEAWVEAVARRRGYTVTAHRADVFGLCGRCTNG